MNKIYIGRSCDLNIGNGKTVSAVREVLREHLINSKTIYSNIKIKGVDYIQLYPETLSEALDTQGAVILLDEIYSILHKNHRISTTCSQHEKEGLCFDLIEFYRQVRKRGITTISTAQTFADCHFQMRTVMQEIIICEKFHINHGIFRKCQTDICPSDHGIHYIKQTNYRTGDCIYFQPEMFYDSYDSSELVRGWTK